MNIAKKNSLVFLGLLLVLLMFSIFVSSAAASGSSYKINLAQFETGEELTAYRIAEYFVKKVDELSDGRITVKHFAGDLLGDWETQQIQVKEGSLDMCMAPGSATFDPEFEFTRLPYLVFTWEGAKKVYGPGGAGEKLINKICERNNTHSLGVEPEGFTIALSTKEYTPFPGDPTIKKLKTRVMPSKIDEIIGQAIGFSTLSMSWGEIHGALMLGTIDAAMGPSYPQAILFKDVVKYQYNFNYGFGAAPWIINLDLWKSLTKEDQEILQTAMTEAIGIEWDRGVKTQEESLAVMREAGVKTVDLTKEQMAACVTVLREKVWGWAAENMFSKEFMNTISSFAEPIPE